MDGRIDLVLLLLLKLLREPHALVRWLAATCLGQLGAPARVARPQLWDALRAEAESSQVRASIIRALERIGARPESERKAD
jgi:HEAT repeat protein